MKNGLNRALLFAVIMCGSMVLGASQANAAASDQAQRLFNRIAGVPISLSDPRLAQMINLIQQGNMLGAALIAAADDGFSNITVRHMVAPMSNRDESLFVPVNDFVSTFIGVARDDLDARELLTGNYIYKALDPANTAAVAANPGKVGVAATITVNAAQVSIHTDDNVYRSNAHFQYLNDNNVNLARSLVKGPQRVFIGRGEVAGNTIQGVAAGTAPVDLVDTAGLLTTRQWAEAHYNAGTNRRPMAQALNQFACYDMAVLRDSNVLDDRVRKDVERSPGGSTQTYLTQCRTCHSTMDAMGGAFASFDYAETNGGRYMVYNSGLPQFKMNRKATGYPDGFLTTDDSWVNRFTNPDNAARMGWKNEGASFAGRGVKSLGVALANSGAYARCMSIRAFTEVCRRPPSSSEDAVINSLSSGFVSSGYKIKNLISAAAVVSSCIGQ